MMNKYSDLLSLSQLTAPEFGELLALAGDQKQVSSPALNGKNIALIFEKPSLRTRVTFEVAIRQLGGWPILLGAKESRLGERETVPDMARNLSLWVDAVVARVFRHVDLEELAMFATIPVINALSDWEHPCQALADILTLTEVWPDFDGKQVAYVGDWNNVSRSLWKACEFSGLGFRAICPKGFGPAEGENAVWFSETEALEGVDAVYTDVWASMGKEEELEDRIAIFRPYQVNEQLMEKTGRSAYFLHCLPAHRGLEVTDAVMDADYSLVFQQAANRLPAEKAVLISVMENHHEATKDKEGRAGILGRAGHVDHHSMAQRKLRM
jgi:ornithine carbamoyltransferase